MLQQLRTATVLLAAMTVLTGGIYPLLVTVIAQVGFPHAANGSLIYRHIETGAEHPSDVVFTNRYDWVRGKDRVVPQGLELAGSELIGQSFTQPEHFWGRLSATGPSPYNAASSSGSNFGPLHPGLKDAVAARITALKVAGNETPKVPVDLVTASGSGLDPHISPAAAEFQIPRIAAATKMKEVVIRDLVHQHTEARQFGILGEPRVNVLRLNLAIDRLQNEK